MDVQLHVDSDTLIPEIARYLVAVDAFRAADCEPTWRPELELKDGPIVLRLAPYGQAAPAAGS